MDKVSGNFAACIEISDHVGSKTCLNYPGFTGDRVITRDCDFLYCKIHQDTGADPGFRRGGFHTGI